MSEQTHKRSSSPLEEEEDTVETQHDSKRQKSTPRKSIQASTGENGRGEGGGATPGTAGVSLSPSSVSQRLSAETETGGTRSDSVFELENQSKRICSRVLRIPTHADKGENSTPLATPWKHLRDASTPHIPPGTALYTSQDSNATGKRHNYLSWDDYFMSVTFLSAMRSKDPSTQVGACIVNDKKRIVGIGYNGFPMGCSDDALPWARKSSTGSSSLDTKYPYVCHAEMNAILNKNSERLQGCSIYVALFPCNECAKLIIQSGIEEVVFLSDKYHNTDSMKASRRMFELSGVKCRRHIPEAPAVLIDFSSAWDDMLEAL